MKQYVLELHGRTSRVSFYVYCHIRQDGLLYNAEREMLVIT